jgi:hypothetical protein
MNVTDEQVFMLPRHEWKRLHDQLQQNNKLTGRDLKAKIEVGPDTIWVRFDGLEGAAEWKFRFL